MKYVLIDDERMAVEHLKKLILKTGMVKEESLVLFTNPMDAIHYIEREKPEVVFTDIEMPMVSGMTLVTRAKNCCPDIEVIFVTAHKQYAVDAFEQYALDYLLKPLMLERVRKTLERIELRRKEKTMAVPMMEHEILIRLMGNVETVKHGEVVDFKWRSGKIRELFAFLLHHRKRSVSKYEIFDSVLPEEEEEKSNAALNMILYRLRSRLASNELPITIKFQDEAYRLILGDEVQVDLDLWEKHLNAMPEVTSQNLNHCLRFLDLVKGPYMKNLDYPWLVDKHDIIMEKYVERLRKIADYYNKHEKYEHALEFYRKIYDLDPLNEWVITRMLKIYNFQMKENAAKNLLAEIKEIYREYGVEVPKNLVSI